LLAPDEKWNLEPSTDAALDPAGNWASRAIIGFNHGGQASAGDEGADAAEIEFRPGFKRFDTGRERELNRRSMTEKKQSD